MELLEEDKEMFRKEFEDIGNFSHNGLWILDFDGKV
jgi:hypothetical protein